MEEVGGKHVQPSSAMLAIVQRDQKRSAARTATVQPAPRAMQEHSLGRILLADAASKVIVFLTPSKACAMCGGREDEDDESFAGMFRKWAKPPRLLKGQWYNDGRFCYVCVRVYQGRYYPQIPSMEKLCDSQTANIPLFEEFMGLRKVAVEHLKAAGTTSVKLQLPKSEIAY